MIQIFVENTDAAHDLFATMTDLNTSPPSVVLLNQRINRGAQAAVNVQEDGSGNCLVNVACVSADDATVVKNFPNQQTQANGIIQVVVF